MLDPTRPNPDFAPVEFMRWEAARGIDWLIPRDVREAVPITPADIESFLDWLEFDAENAPLLRFIHSETLGRDMHRIFGDVEGFAHFDMACAVMSTREECTDAYTRGIWSTFARDHRTDDRLVIDLMDDALVLGWQAPSELAAAIERLRDIAAENRAVDVAKHEAAVEVDLDRQRADRAADMAAAKSVEAAIEKRRHDAVWNDDLTEQQVDAICTECDAERETWKAQHGRRLWPWIYQNESDEAVMPQLAIVPAPILATPAPDLIQTSGAFVEGFVPPEYVLDRVLQRRFCYSMTAQTGVGKTAVAMLLTAHVAAGRALGALDVAKGSVLYFAGENPTDIQMRWLGLTQELKLDPRATDVHFVPGAVPLSQVAERITAEVARKNLTLALVVVDTAAAYFEGDDENSNSQSAEHARRMRSLTMLPGGPCVVILCHPTKRAADDDLIPRGGGAFLAEVDGNIALHKRETLIVASAQGKFRGADFAPISFELNAVTHPVLKDSLGRDIWTVVAKPLTDAGKQQLEAASRRHEDGLLRAIEKHPRASLRELAEALRWLDKAGKPVPEKVRRAAELLAREKLILKHRGAWQLTQKGQKELNELDRAKADSNYPLTPVTPLVTPPVQLPPIAPPL
jgi:hypothetical protein